MTLWFLLRIVIFRKAYWMGWIILDQFKTTWLESYLLACCRRLLPNYWRLIYYRLGYWFLPTMNIFRFELQKLLFAGNLTTSSKGGYFFIFKAFLSSCHLRTAVKLYSWSWYSHWRIRIGFHYAKSSENVLFNITLELGQ